MPGRSKRSGEINQVGNWLLRAEPFNGRLRDERLNLHWFLSLEYARAKIDAWRRDYDESRPHTSLGWLTPIEYAAAAAKIAAE